MKLHFITPIAVLLSDRCYRVIPSSIMISIKFLEYKLDDFNQEVV